MRVKIVVALACLAASIAQAGTKPTSHTMQTAVKQYLTERGDLCLGKYSWPRDVTAEDRQNGSNDALQMPVFERLGLVTSIEVAAEPAGDQPATASAADHPPGDAQAADAPAASSVPGAVGPVKRYSLTPRGQQFYLQRKMTNLNIHDEAVDHDGDFCVAHLSLDKVVKWTPPETFNGHLQTTVAYTYKVKPADWTSDEEVRKVLPRVDMVIRGEGTLQLNETFVLQGRKWVPVLPGK